MSDNCLFCELEEFSIIAENDNSYAILDKYPVTELHTLIISKKHYQTVFEMPDHELTSIVNLAKICRANILKKDKTVKGFNFGANSGSVAGQKIMHVHFHLIPRRTNDVAPPPAMQ